MSLFQQLEKLNIPLGELKDLTEKEIIRIEKKLKAAVVFDKSIDINHVNQILETLKDSKNQLKHVTNLNTYWFRKIVSKPNDLITFPIKETPNEEFTEETKQFIEDNFKSELTTYYTNCLKNNHYRALHSLLFYHKLLPHSILDEIQSKLIQKMEYGMECLNINASEIDKKIFFLYNPFFFKSLNFLNPLNLESIIPSLVNLIIKKSKHNNTLLRVHFCLGMYIPISDSLKRVLKQNQQFAISKGVSQNLDYKKHPKGETYSTSDNYQNGQVKSYLTVFIFVGIIITIAIFIALALNNSPHKQKDIIIPVTIQTFIDEALINQSNPQNRLLPHKIPFNEDTIGFLNMNPNKDRKHNITITNKSDKHVALVMMVDSGYSILCIRPHQKRTTSCNINTYTTYQGDYPVKFSSFNSKGDIIKGFMFTKFDIIDKSILKLIRFNRIVLKSTRNYFFDINYGSLDLISEEEQKESLK
jgi:hypothetical protein